MKKRGRRRKEAARPDDGTYVDGDDFEVVAKPTAEDAPCGKKSRKVYDEPVPMLAIQATYNSFGNKNRCG